MIIQYVLKLRVLMLDGMIPANDHQSVREAVTVSTTFRGVMT
jgi:hypothetical protein